MCFVSLHCSMSAVATTLTLATAINCIGIGFQRGTHTRRQLVANDGTGPPTLTDMGASFTIAIGGALALFITAPQLRERSNQQTPQRRPSPSKTEPKG